MGKTDKKGTQRSRSRSPSSDSSDEGKKRKHKKEHKKEHKKKKHKSDKHEDLLEQAKHYLKQHLRGGGAGGNAGGGPDMPPPMPRPPPGGYSKPPGTPDLTEDDYYSRAAEFQAWLLEAKHRLFNDLSAEQGRTLFVEFCGHWNAGALPPKFYAGLVVAPTRRTAHDWGLARARGERGGGAGGAGMVAFLDDQRTAAVEAKGAARVELRAGQRSWRSEQRLLVDEMLPKPTGGTHEARVEARAARREAAAARGGSPDRPMGVSDVMGGGDDFAAARAREAARTAHRTAGATAKREVLAGRLAAAAAEEAAKMDRFRVLVASGPISIPKRQPPQ